MKAKSVKYKYKASGQNAVDDISLEFETGKTYGIIGPNGVGKTTLLSLLAGIIEPDEGEISGFDKTGVLIQGIGMYDEADANENLEIFCQEIGVSSKNNQYVLSLVGISENQAKVKLKTCSQGFKQRMLIARSLVRCEGVVLLDEPFSALDYDNVKVVSDGLVRLVKDKSTTVIVSSHRLQEIEKIIDTAIFINAGRIVEVVNMGDEMNYISLKCRNVESVIAKVSSKIPSVRIEKYQGGISIQYDTDKDYDTIMGLVLSKEIDWISIEKSRSLVHVYDKFINS